jgi:transcriptional regulator GlxA family with amidase domain
MRWKGDAAIIRRVRDIAEADWARRGHPVASNLHPEGFIAPCSPYTMPKVAGATANHFGFLTLRQFSMIAFTNALEALRMANYLSGQPTYRWSVYTLDGAPAPASNGLTIAETVALDDNALPDVLFVCGGVDVHRAIDKDLVQRLRRVARKRVTLGGLCTGSYALASAGLLDGYSCAIHWENMSALRENFPRVVFTEELFVIDRDRYTCTGGIAPLELMLKLMTPRIGRKLAAGISEQFILDRVRDDSDQQHIPLAVRLGGRRGPLAQAAKLMEEHLEETLSLDDLARLSDISQRQLQRLFRHRVGMTPAQYYLQLRLRRARELLLQTSMPIMKVAVACGFGSAGHFSKAYRACFGRAPASERHVSDAPQASISLSQRMSQKH